MRLASRTACNALMDFFSFAGYTTTTLANVPGAVDVENHRALELSRRRRHEHVLKLPQTIVRLAGVEEERLAVSALALALALANDDALEPRGWDATRSALVREQVELDRNHLCADFAHCRESWFALPDTPLSRFARRSPSNVHRQSGHM